MRSEQRLAWRLLRRQWQSGELRLVATATVLAAMLATLLAAVGDRLEQSFVYRAADMLGADLVLTGSRVPTQDLDALAAEHGLTLSRTVDFSTMLAAPDAGDDDPVLLTAARAVDANYPLRGELQVLRNDKPVRAERAPARGEIWVEPRVAEELGLRVGDQLALGLVTLTISELVVQEPDRGGSFMALSPRVLFSQADIAAAGVVQPGSRVRFRSLLSGAQADIERVRAQLEPSLRADQDIVAARSSANAGKSGNRRASARLDNAMQFFALAGVLGIVLCGAAIGVAADRHARRLYDTVALLRTFGLQQAVIRQALLLEIFALALLAGVLGAALGFAGQFVLIALLGDLLPATLPPAGSAALVAGLMTALVALPVFSLPALARLRDISPLHVLRRDVVVVTARTQRHYLLGVTLLAAFAIASAPQPKLAALTLLGIASLLLVALPLAALFTRLLKRWRPRFGLAMRLAADRLADRPWRFGAQLVAFALILTTMTLAGLLRGDLLKDWQQQLPANTPNVFVINLLPHEDTAFVAALARQRISAPELYRVSPGRLLRINATPLEALLADKPEAAGALDRDIVLTEARPGARNAGDGNRPLFAGTANSGAQVSVEEKLAQQLALRIGDTLTFVIAGVEVSARVSGFREVDWNSFQPNFFMVLSPGALGDSPYTFLTSFRSDDVAASVRALRSEFPAASLLEVGPLLARMQEMVSALAGGVQFVLALLLVAALVLLVATVATTLEERLAQAAILRTLGASQALLRASLLAEFALLGLLAGVLAMLGTEAARALLLVNLLEMRWTPLPWAWLLVPPGSAALLALTGWLAARGSLRADAATVLKEA